MLNMLLALALALPAGNTDAASERATLPPAEQVLAIPDALRKEFQHKVLSTKSPEQRLYRLVDFMLKPDGLGLQYKFDATNTVAESYRTRQVNCMAFTVMAVALAREAGLPAYAQQIDNVIAWDMADGVVTQILHANAVVLVDQRKYMVDIAAGNLLTPVVNSRISDEHLLALFYSNRAMELLATGRLTDAMTWQNEAMRHDQRDATLWNNSGVLNQRLGNMENAERMYLNAVDRNPRLSSALSNLVALYRDRGDFRSADHWKQRSEKVLSKDPYYQFTQGRHDEIKGDYQGAIDYYRRAISLYKGEHMFHFFLARAYSRMGRLQDADSELSIAQELSGSADRQRYQAKRDALHRMIYGVAAARGISQN